MDASDRAAQRTLCPLCCVIHNDMHEPPRQNDGSGHKDPQNDARLKAAMRARGWLKLVLVTIAANQVLSTAFVYLAQQIDPRLTMVHTLVFSCVTCGLVGHWLQADAYRAWRNALEKGYLRKRCAADEDILSIADNCPGRWLVVLHIELNPQLANRF
ncbi:hypothetical protein [Paraburkholderia sp. HD33-4]|uniref:hypothetical protein n=1 Tax=Paraburkholderia sp. HD33-4 TaxID=2883242 RepID=UPI001F2EEBB7|nr:hypothetical protein [Paraburkholderia sp. HD33-4]